MPAQGMRLILAFLVVPCKWHDKQRTLAEIAAYIAGDIVHIDFGAEARVNKPQQPSEDYDSEQ